MVRRKGDISSMDTAKEMRTELVEMDQFSITITCECKKKKKLITVVETHEGLFVSCNEKSKGRRLLVLVYQLKNVRAVCNSLDFSLMVPRCLLQL